MPPYTATIERSFSLFETCKDISTLHNGTGKTISLGIATGWNVWWIGSRKIYLKLLLISSNHVNNAMSVFTSHKPKTYICVFIKLVYHCIIVFPGTHISWRKNPNSTTCTFINAFLRHWLFSVNVRFSLLLFVCFFSCLYGFVVCVKYWDNYITIANFLFSESFFMGFDILK
jgi:hypothetical protein